ncbi:MAG: PAS domain-containing protein [Pseudomonadota bacterium]
MEDLPNTFSAGTSAFSFDQSTAAEAGLFGSDILDLLLGTLAEKLEQSLFVVTATGRILLASGARFGTEEACVGGRFASLWPRESRSLAQGALDAALTEARELSFVVACIPGEIGPQTWEATLTPLQPARPSDAPLALSRRLVLLALRDVTSETRVADLKKRAR